MSSQDDPEVRIRELERSLSEKTSELTRSSAEAGQGPRGGYVGTRAIPSPPPYQGHPSYGAPPPHGGPFPTVPTSSGGRGIRGLLVVGAMALITSGIIAGGVYFFSSMVSEVDSLIDVRPSSPTVSGGGGPFGEPPSSNGANRPRLTIAESTVSSGPSGGNISVSGVGDDRTIECNEGVVSISGVSNTVVLVGHCASVTISGIENVVTIDESDVISASGFDNRVTYRSGSPVIQNSGGSNVVEQG